MTGITTITGQLDIKSSTDISGITTVTNSTDNTIGNADTGAFQIDGGVGINKNLTIGAAVSIASDLHVGGYQSLLVLQHLEAAQSILVMPILTILTSVVNSSQVLFLTQTKTYDLGEFDKQWRDVYAGGSVYGYESLLVLQVLLQLHILLLLLLRLLTTDTTVVVLVVDISLTDLNLQS